MRGKRAVLITGTRELPDRAGRALIARAFQGYKPDVIVVGCARGVDKFAREWAREFGITPLVSKADWKGLGKGAGYARNKDACAGTPERWDELHVPADQIRLAFDAVGIKES